MIMRKCLPGLACLAMVLGSVWADMPVGTFHTDFQRTGRSPFRGPVAADLLWSFETGSSLAASPLVGQEGTILLASTDGHLYAISSEGEELWKFAADESLFATPSADAEGNLYFGDLAGWFYALRPDGSLKWKHRLQGNERRVLGSAVVTPEGCAYVAAWNDRLYAFDPSGGVRWQARLGGMPTASPALDASGNIYVAGLDPDSRDQLLLTCFRPDSAIPAWTFRAPLGLDRHRIVASPAIDLVRNRIYLGACSSTAGILWAIDLESGLELFRRHFPKGIVSSPAIGLDGLVVVGCLDGKVYALEPEQGQQRWALTSGAPYVLGSPAFDVLGNVYIGDSDGTIRAVSALGVELWRFSAQANIESAPVVHRDRVYVTSFDGTLYALAAETAVTGFFPQVANGSSGISRLQSKLRFTNTDDDSVLQLEFFNSDGGHMLLDVGLERPLTSISVPLLKGHSVTFETSGEGNLGDQIGFARFTGGSGIGAAAILKYAEGPVVMYETGVPCVTDTAKEVSLLVDSAEHRGMGVAIVNTAEQDAEVTMRLYNADFNLLAVKTMRDLLGVEKLRSESHFAKFAFEIFPQIDDLEMSKALITVESDQPLAAATLCQSGDPEREFPEKVTTLSVFPVAPGRPEVPSQVIEPHEFWFPQFADGIDGDIGLRTVLFFANTGEPALTRLEFFDQAGQPAEFELVGFARNSTVEFLVGKGQVVRLETPGSGALRSGYVHVSTGAGVTANLLYSYTQAAVTLFEAAVPASTPVDRLTVFVESEPGSVNTAIGAVNLGLAPAEVVLRLYDANFNLIAEEVLRNPDGPLAPGEALTKYLSELVGAEVAARSNGGVMTLRSSQPLAVLSLREAGSGAGFPQQVYRLSLMPVISGSAEP
jgi:outer membrane protein assembly factor BamB